MTVADVGSVKLDFSDQAMVVTGGAQGIGLATARLLVGSGACVVLADVNGDQARKAADSLAATGPGTAVGVSCDVTDEQSVAAVVECALGLTTPLSGWVNNAGITKDATMRKMSLDMFREVIDVHLAGMWLGLRAASSVMRETGSGSIVNLSSISGKVGDIEQLSYSAAKAGVVGLTKAAAKELGHVGCVSTQCSPGSSTPR